MGDDKADPSNKDPKISSADDLVKTTKSGDVELSEEELKRVTGGGQVNIKLTTTPKDKVDTYLQS